MVVLKERYREMLRINLEKDFGGDVLWGWLFFGLEKVVAG